MITKAPSIVPVSLITIWLSSVKGVLACKVGIVELVTMRSGATWISKLSVAVPPSESVIVIVTVDVPNTPETIV